MKLRLAALVGFFVALLLLSSDSIMQLNLKLLRIGLAREQIMKYELSSRLLRYKFKRLLYHSEEMETELGLSVADSATINNARLADLTPESSWREGLALYLVNGIRALGLKGPLSLEDDRKLLRRLQAAFYFERLKQYGKATELYGGLVNELQRGSPEHGFALLHSGYCAALKGETTVALKNLEQVRQDYAGSHFGESAEILLEILAERERQRKRIEAIRDLGERAREYYRSGRFQEALQTIGQVADPPAELTLIRARSLEESGNMEEARVLYNKIVESPGIPAEALKSANRRLLIVNSIYLPDASEAEEAALRARRLGDTAMVQSIKTAASLRVAPVIEETEDPVLAPVVRHLLDQEKEAQALATPQTPVVPPERPGFQLLLVDHRSIESAGLEIKNDLALVEVDNLQMALPHILLQELRTPRGAVRVEIRGSEPLLARTMRFEKDRVIISLEDGEKELLLSDIESVHMDPHEAR